jgi:hypothetical protein
VQEIIIGTKKTTAIDLLLAQFTAVPEQPQSSSPVLVKKLQKVVYGLGSLLRGNRPAQVHFLSVGGPELLGTTLTGLLLEEGSSSHAHKMTKRLLMLADDIVSDVKLAHEEANKMTDKLLSMLADDIVSDVKLAQEEAISETAVVDETIVQAFSTAQWCELAVLALRGDPTIHETALLTVATLADKCARSSWNMDGVQQAIFQIRDHWQKEGSNMDPDILKERLELIESTMNVLTQEIQK